MILTENLTKYFKDLKAVDNVNLHVKAGEVLALLGPNGAGKTTTVRLLTTVLKPSSGTARVATYDVLENPSQVRSSVGVLTEDHGLYDRMHIEEYLDFFGQIYDMPADEREKRIQYLLGRFGLLDARNRRIGKFSKGMMQRLGLAQAIIHDPRLLILDEPTSGLDFAASFDYLERVQKLAAQGHNILIVTHHLNEIPPEIDRIILLRDGRIAADQTELAAEGPLA